MSEVWSGSGRVPAPAKDAAAGDAACLHCRQAILHSTFRNGRGETFCCHGCLQVHAILGDQDWGRYYDLLEQGGRKAPKAVAGEEYGSFLATLEDPKTLAAMGKWEGGLHKVSLESRELVCAACGWLVENLLRATAGVRAFEVDFLHGELFLAYEPGSCSLKDILAAISRFGYRFRAKAADAPARPTLDRSLLARLAVSGACFANSMAFAAANYIGAFQDITAEWVEAFGLMSFAVAVPAVGYSAYPFYAGAWRALRTRKFSIDATITIGILLSLASTVTSVLGGRAGNFADSLAGLVFFLLLGRWGVQRFEAGLALNGRWFDALRKGKVRVRRGPEGAVCQVECGEVQAGETVEVAPGDYLPLDGVLESPQAWLDTGLLTGESRPIHRRAGDPVFAGSLNLKAPIDILVTGASGFTRIDSLGRKLDDLASARRTLPDGMAKVAGWFTLAVTLAGIAAFLFHLRDGFPPAAAISASVFIISCSCALALAGPICRGLGLKRAQALGYHFKDQRTLEALDGVRCVLFDKTGTLTFTHRTVSGWTWVAPIEGDTPRRLEILRSLKGLVRHSLHPVSVSLGRALESVEGPEPGLTRVREIPHFGIVARWQDGGHSREICLCRYGAWSEKDGAFTGLGYRSPWADKAAVADPPADACVFVDGELSVLIRFTDEVKPDLVELMQSLERRGIAPVLLSGDNREKVEAFATKCGIADFHGDLAPEEKKAWAVQYKARFGRCLAVGDGFNDSLLFGVSDLAMAIQGGAVDLSAGTDILSTGDRPSALPRLFDLSHGVNRGITACYWVSGIYNAGAVAAAMAGWVTPLFAAVLMPVSSLSLCLAAWLAIPRR